MSQHAVETKGRVVITGGPSTGKTTQTKFFRDLGFPTLSESARLIYNRQRAQGLTNEEIFANNKEQFNNEIFWRQDKREIEFGKYNSLAFFDRSRIDSVAYIDQTGRPTNTYRHVVENRPRYLNPIFLLDEIGFVDDGVRNEDPEKRAQLQTALLETYQSFGYEVVLVPAGTVEERGLLMVSLLGLTLPTLAPPLR